MAEMERPHVSLLDLLVVSATPDFTVACAPGCTLSARPGRRRPAVAPRDPEWTADQIETIRPELKPALDGLMGTLIRHGLAVENNEAAEALEEALRGFERRAQEQARQITGRSRLTAGSLQPYILQVSRITRNLVTRPNLANNSSASTGKQRTIKSRRPPGEMW